MPAQKCLPEEDKITALISEFLLISSSTSGSSTQKSLVIVFSSSGRDKTKLATLLSTLSSKHLYLLIV